MGVRYVPEVSGEQGKMEGTGCEIVCGAPTTLPVKGLMMMMMMLSGPELRLVFTSVQYCPFTDYRKKIFGAAFLTTWLYATERQNKIKLSTASIIIRDCRLTCTGSLEPPREHAWKHGALHPQKPLRLIRDGEVGGFGIFISNTYSLHCHHQNDSAFRWAAV